MKMKEFGPQAGARSWRPPLDPPMEVIDKLQFLFKKFVIFFNHE